MKLEIDNSDIQKVAAPYPIGFVNDFLNHDDCKKIFDEISLINNYDDLVMNGRYRVNKGSKNFSEYLKKFKNLSSLYNMLNDENFYELMRERLEFVKSSNTWKPEIDKFKYSKKNFGEQKFNLIKIFRRSSIISKFFEKTINLDIDFSTSKKGYFRKAHRDRDTRIVSFLLYLNTIDKKMGGEFEVYEYLDDNKIIEDLKRFPDDKKVRVIDKFSPKSGQLFFFLSTPDSYHGVSKFISDSEDRVFIYGSYSLDRKVKWNFFGKKT